MKPQFFVKTLQEKQIDFFTGVPDSLLKSVCAYIQDNIAPENNIIAANEGAAIGLATGYYLATKKIPVVYMQNSGLGNTINPIASLVDKEVYNIPMLLLVGWRGEPGTKDEPQHVKQGKVTVPLLEALNIKNTILSSEENQFKEQLHIALKYIEDTNEPYAFIVKKDTFEEYKLQNSLENNYTLSREDAIQTVVDCMGEKDIVVSTTGMISRELFEYREAKKQGHQKDFLTVGSMGHASQIALGIALQKKHRKVFCFDGDGATLMHMGSLAITGSLKPKNFIHIIFNNGAHDSVGGQPTVGFNVNFPEIALSSGYTSANSVDNIHELKKTLTRINTNLNGPVLIEIKVKKGARKDLGRPTTTPIENKNSFMDFLNND